MTPEDLAAAEYPDAAGRARGFRAVAGEDAPVVQARELTVEAGTEAALLLLDVPAAQRPTAVVAQADLLAAGAVRAAESLGLRVPEDVTVTGFDGVDLPWLGHVLTTVLQPGADKGRALGAMVRRALDGLPVADEPFPVSLRVGTTSAPPPADRGRGVAASAAAAARCADRVPLRPAPSPASPRAASERLGGRVLEGPAASKSTCIDPESL